MSIRSALAGAAAVSCMLAAGCVSTSGDVQGARLSDNFEVYAPFDNERDWGPSYLVDAPYHHFGDGVRIDDTRSIPQNADVAISADAASAADPSRPPLTGAKPPPPQPLP